MQDKILESLFLDTSLWAEVIEHGRLKKMPMSVLMYLQSPHNRAELYLKIVRGEYEIQPPHTGYRPKEDGGERMFLANEPLDRLLLNAICKWLMRNEQNMVHPACRSYQEGIGVGQIVKKLSQDIVKYSKEDSGCVVGYKFDIQHYFESVDRKYIHKAFDIVESHYGHSAIISLLRKYYNSDVYYDTRLGETVEQYQGIKQGCAVSSWLANVILYQLDERLSDMEGCYVRYSDDIIYVGPELRKAARIVKEQLESFGLTLNEQKVEHVQSNKFIRFLGYYIRGDEITLSPKWVKRFQQTIEHITIHNKKLIHAVRNIHKQHSDNSEKQLIRIVNHTAKQLAAFLYLGNGQYSWAALTLGVLNRQDDIKQLTLYCMDALRAVFTGKTGIGGLGVSKEKGIIRGKGKSVLANRKKTEHIINEKNFCSISAMKKVIHNKWLFRALVWELIQGDNYEKFTSENATATDYVDICTLERLYEEYCYSRPNEKHSNRFYAKTLSDLTIEDLMIGKNRTEAEKRLKKWIADNITSQNFPAGSNQWYWQCAVNPELVLLRKWFD